MQYERLKMYPGAVEDSVQIRLAVQMAETATAMGAEVVAIRGARMYCLNNDADIVQSDVLVRVDGNERQISSNDRGWSTELEQTVRDLIRADETGGRPC